MEHNFFPQRPAVTPTIYAYRLPGVDSHKGYLKIGYTDRSAKERIEEQLHTSKIKYEIVLVESAMANDGSCFTDKDIHKILESKGCRRLNPLDKTDEWFKCLVSDVEAAILSLRTGLDNVENRTQNFTMRPEQFSAVEKTKKYFDQALKEEPDRTPKVLVECKNAFRENICQLSAGKENGLVADFNPYIQTCCRIGLERRPCISYRF